MRSMRTAAAALIGATALTGLTAPLASAREGAASVSPSRAAPGQTVTVTVSCEKSDKPEAKTITARSDAFEGGPVTLTLGPDGKHSGSARLTGRHTGDSKVDGTCPDGGAFATNVAVAGTSDGSLGKSPDKSLGEWGEAAGEWAGSLGQSGVGSRQIAPHGSVQTGLGGSVAANPAELAGGLALVVGGVGGFWLLRRRGA
ncbi:hypothetical protein ACFU7Y_17130 [Kitasatospora sp. NPDC057542]|uniref:hypothetical protein n=1 Tax=Kitasatospora sp. NPDC057542 TaxID=3346162 RepID=UPI0036A91298